MRTRPRRALLPAVAAASLVLSACAASGSSPGSGGGAGSASTSASAPAASASVPSSVKAVIPTDHGPAGFVATTDAIWVSNHRAGTLEKIDPATNRVVGSVTVGGEANISDNDPAWACTNADSKAHHIDVTALTVTSSAETGCNGGSIRVVGATAWVAAGPDDVGVTLLDASSGTVRKHLPLPASGSGGPVVLAHGRVIIGGGSTTAAYTPAGASLGMLPVDTTWLVPPIGSDIYRVPDDGRITQLDPVTLKPILVIPAPKHLDDWNWALAGDNHGHLWYRPDYTHVYAVDTATKAVTLLITLPWEESPTGLVYAFGSLWISNFDQDTVWRVDVAP